MRKIWLSEYLFAMPFLFLCEEYYEGANPILKKYLFLLLYGRVLVEKYFSSS